MKVRLSENWRAGSGRIPELDGMRGAAVLAVVVAHYFGEPPHGIRFLTLGWIGVDLFFVLSGFLIGGILIANRDSSSYFATFYVRRACRIFPAYYAVVALTIGAAALLSGASSLDPLLPTGVYLTYSQNFALAILDEARGPWLLPTWTLAVEEQFYLLLPVIIYLTPPRQLLPLTFLFIVSGPLFRLATMPGLASLVLLPSRWDLLFIGVLAAQIWRNSEWFRRVNPALRPCAILSVLAALLMAIVDERLGTDLLVLFGPTFLGLLFAAYILLAVSGAPEGRRFRGRMLCFFGRISYGLYLIHIPVTGTMHALMLGAKPDVGSISAAVVTAASLALSVAVAWLSWRWFESPIVRFGHRWGYGTSPQPSHRSRLRVLPRWSWLAGFLPSRVSATMHMHDGGGAWDGGGRGMPSLVRSTTGANHWLTLERLRVYPRLALLVYAIIAVGWTLMSVDLIDPSGKPLGYDFITFWAASWLTLAGNAVAAFDPQQIFAVERLAVPANDRLFLWHYPPTFSLVVLPLALAPYFAAWFAWVLSTLCGYLYVIRRFAPRSETLWIALAFPGAFVNVLHGQNGFLSAALFGGAILMLERRPILAGILFGLLSCKPQLGLLVPIALLCGRQWVAFMAASGTTVLFAGLSIAILGVEPWIAFWNNMPLIQQLLDNGNLPWGKIPSLYAALRILHVSAPVAYALHAVLAAVVLIMITRIWWRGDSLALNGAALVAGAVLIPPYLFDYDLALLAIPIAILAWHGAREGWLPWEREILVAAWLAPELGSILGTYLSAPVMPLVLLALLFAVLRRALVGRAPTMTPLAMGSVPSASG